MALKTPAALAAALTLALAAGCASTGAAGTRAGGGSVDASATSGSPGDAYPSTYQRIASAPVLVSGATVLDGTGR
ncbi:MAG: amidohydrolase, partial [Gammaproteobacteria bacterium]|nr:amidohydrolase [Gammaproteobacteria bacterium]